VKNLFTENRPLALCDIDRSDPRYRSQIDTDPRYRLVHSAR
jgi:hypothetical protein